MANQEHLDIIKQGVEVWNKWIGKHRNIQPDLGGANLRGADLRGADLRGANLHEASLKGANLHEASLRGANLHEADLRGADLSGTDLHEADLSGANLHGADLSGANLSGIDLSGKDLRRANLEGAHLSGVDLYGANLSFARLQGTDLRDSDLRQTYLGGANLSRADLRNADFRGAILSEGTAIPGSSVLLRSNERKYRRTVKCTVTYFTEANLSKANLHEAHLSGANLAKADLSKANLNRAILHEADLSGANLSGTYLHEANLSGANLSGADLSGANLSGANLSGANLSRANLSRANLSWATLVQSDLTKANLNGSLVYGIAVWDVKMEGTIQSNLVITPRNQSTITVDNLKNAQFIYLLLNNKEIREIIDTITSKVVLILGRFTPVRKAILDALRDELRKRNYTPIVFDFEKPTNRDFTETVRTLAHLSRFIIADITEPSSIPQELQAIVPDLEVPVQPLLEEGTKQYAMFPDFSKYSWVFSIYKYKDQTSLIPSLKNEIIEPAEKKASELAIEKAKRLERP
jgi:uncharacterized protein YjbI with pentapeptide repeats